MSGSLFEQYKAALRRGHVAALAGDLDEALDAYRAAARLVPERALPHASQGTVLHRLDRWPEASAAFDRALQLAPDDEAALRARATAREERGLRSGAAADFERLAFVLDIAGRGGESAASARRAAGLEPTPAREALVARLAAAAGAPPADQEAPESTPAPAPETEAGEAESQAAGAPEDLDAKHAETSAAAPSDDETADGPSAAPSLAEDAGDLALEGDDPDEVMSPASAALAARIAELGTQPAWVEMGDRAIGAHDPGEGEGGVWPPVDLPSPPPPPIEGPPPDPEELLAEAARLVEEGDVTAARDRMLLAAMVHRTAGRIDAAMEVCLRLLAMAPGDAQVHLAIANLQLDRGWSHHATEKIELLLRLTSLTGDTQGEADAHGLASERLRDDTTSRPATG